MANHTLNLQLLDQSNSLSNSDESSYCEDFENTDNQCGSNCGKKLRVLVQNALKDKKDIKELEVQLAKFEMNALAYAEKIKDKDDVIAALKTTIDLCKNNNNSNNSSSSSPQWANLKSQIKADSVSLKEKDDLLKEAQAKIDCLANQVKHLESFIHNSEENVNQFMAEGKVQIEACERQIAHLLTELTKKDNELALLRTETKQKDDQLAFLELGNNMDSMKIKEKDDLLSASIAKIDDLKTELEKKTNRLTTLEHTIKEQSHLIEELQSNFLLQETHHEQLIKERDNKNTDLQESKAKINGYSNTVKQLKQNIADLQAAATRNKTEIETLEATIGKLRAKLKETPKDKSEDPKMDPNIGTGWILILERSNQYKSTKMCLNFAVQCRGFKDGKQYWFGADHLHKITSKQRHELYVLLIDLDDSITYARYDNFVIGSPEEKYRMKSLGKYSGSAGDGLRDHENTQFATCMRGNLKAGQVSTWWYIPDACIRGSCDFNVTSLPGLRSFVWWMGDMRKSVKMLIRPYKK